MQTEEQQVHDVEKTQAVVQPSIPSSMTVSPVHFENQVNNGSMLLIRSIPVFPTPNPSTMVDLNLNQKYETSPLPVSLNLSLSFDHNHNQSSYQVISGFNTGDGMISVA